MHDEDFRRILACKSFKRSSTNLCNSLATLRKRICSEYVDPLTIEPILANRLIPLDKHRKNKRMPNVLKLGLYWF